MSIYLNCIKIEEETFPDSFCQHNTLEPKPSKDIIRRKIYSWPRYKHLKQNISKENLELFGGKQYITIKWG